LTAAPLAVPPALFEQLIVGGRLIAPVGPEGRQELIRYTRGENRIRQESLGAVSFVPLLSGLQR
jgi:protein-L-isoaspartate(D-aspartate) O-methyltransferase